MRPVREPAPLTVTEERRGGGEPAPGGGSFYKDLGELKSTPFKCRRAVRAAPAVPGVPAVPVAGVPPTASSSVGAVGPLVGEVGVPGGGQWTMVCKPGGGTGH